MSLLKKVLNKNYSFPKSKPDMELLRNRECAETGLPDFKCYAAAFNICMEFGEQLLDSIPLLGHFNNSICEMQEEYMPSGPPMSPITRSFFSSWMILDALINENVTLGTLYSRYIHEKKVMLYTAQAMDHLNESSVTVYQVTGGDLRKTILWDILGKRELVASISIYDYSLASYEPAVGDVWYTRILPPLQGCSLDCYSVFGTPIIFRKTTRVDWENFFLRRQAGKSEALNGISNFIKHGNSFGYWLEFVFQTYIGHTREVIFAEGLPDMKDSRPFGELDGGRLSEL